MSTLETLGLICHIQCDQYADKPIDCGWKSHGLFSHCNRDKPLIVSFKVRRILSVCLGLIWVTGCSQIFTCLERVAGDQRFDTMTEEQKMEDIHVPLFAGLGSPILCSCDYNVTLVNIFFMNLAF